MKFKLGILIAIFTLSILTGCEKDGDDVLLNAQMSAKVDDASVNFLLKAASYTNGVITVNGYETILSTGKFVSLVIKAKTPVVGTYDLRLQIGGSALETTTLYYKNASTLSEYNTGYSGKIVINKFDTENKRISGTFEFKTGELTGTTPGPAITEGVFENVRYF